MVRKYDVITVGTARLDAYMKIHDSQKELHKDSVHAGGVCFRLGEKIVVDEYVFQMGGNAANVAVGLSRLGVKATIVAEVGDDEFSIKIRNSLAKENIERLLMVEKRNAPSNLSVIINFAGDRTIFAEEREQEHDFHLEDVEAGWIYLTSLGREWEKPYKTVLDFVKKQKAKIAFNPGSTQLKDQGEVFEEVIRNTEALFVNKEEAERILYGHYKKTDDDSEEYIRKLSKELQKLGPRVVVITNGKEGSSALDMDGNFYLRGLIPGEPIERTGAGDAYASGFLAAIVQGMNIPDAMGWGAVNSSSVVGHIGAEAGLLTRDEMEEMVNK